MTKEELEKEAEENLVEQLGFDKEFIEQEVNKLKNPNNKFMVDALIREVKFAFQQGAEFGYNKANEWHYVKDGDLPKDEKLCLIWCGEKDFNTAEYVRERFWDLCGGWLEVDEVIAWKEIVLPELKESEE